ncbi:MAG: CYTH domain-containing protein [Bacteroidales bacterium]|nr:CYTH domain-containing protein [Bacteroidales bacterium]
MALEIERKFLVDPAKLPQGLDGVIIRQGYMLISQEKSIRIRISGHKAFLTIKGMDRNGVRPEFEYEIPFDDGQDLFDQFTLPGKISKIRYHHIFKKHLWEIDEFLLDNKGLWIAEIELASEDETFDIPDWIVSEVTGDLRFFNTYLSQHPYSTW